MRMVRIYQERREGRASERSRSWHCVIPFRWFSNVERSTSAARTRMISRVAKLPYSTKKQEQVSFMMKWRRKKPCQYLSEVMRTMSNRWPETLRWQVYFNYAINIQHGWPVRSEVLTVSGRGKLRNSNFWPCPRFILVFANEVRVDIMSHATPRPQARWTHFEEFSSFKFLKKILCISHL